MKALVGWTLAAVVAFSGLSIAQSAEKKGVSPGSAREKLVGAWHLAWMEEAGSDGTVTRITNSEGHTALHA